MVLVDLPLGSCRIVILTSYVLVATQLAIKTLNVAL